MESDGRRTRTLTEQRHRMRVSSYFSRTKRRSSSSIRHAVDRRVSSSFTSIGLTERSCICCDPFDRQDLHVVQEDELEVRVTSSGNRVSRLVIDVTELFVPGERQTDLIEHSHVSFDVFVTKVQEAKDTDAIVHHGNNTVREGGKDGPIKLRHHHVP